MGAKRTERQGGGAAGPEAPAGLRAGRAALVGRAGPLAALAGHLAEAGAGRGTVVALAGEPGVGKTRLLEAFPPDGAAAVLRGGASPAEGMPPYLPFLEALGGYVATAPLERLRQAGPGPRAASLAALLPELPARLGRRRRGTPSGRSRSASGSTRRSPGSWRRSPRSGPLVVLLDDLQWADAATLDLLVHVAGRLREAPLLTVCAYREGEAAENAPLVRALAELNRRRLLVTLPLRPLDAAGSAALAAGLLGGAVDPAVAALLHRHGEGNPFFLEELLRSLVEEGALVAGDGRWTLAGPPDPGRRTPPRRTRPRRTRPPCACRGWPRPSGCAWPASTRRWSTCCAWPPSPAGPGSRPCWRRWRVWTWSGRRTCCSARCARPWCGRRRRRPTPSATTWCGRRSTPRSARPAGGACTWPSARPSKPARAGAGGAPDAPGEAGSDRRLADLAYHFVAAGRPPAARLRPALRRARPAGVEANAAAGHFRTALRLLGPDGPGPRAPAP